MKMYDFLIVGAGLCGCVLAERLTNAGASVLVIDKRDVIGGNIACDDVQGITVHKYGAHIFRTNNPVVYKYFTKFCEMNHFVNSPVAKYGNEVYNLPFNMNTFYQMFGAVTPEEARKAIENDAVPCENPVNLEEHALSIVGRKIYSRLIKEYTEKQWGRPCKELSKNVLRRIPLRFTYDNNYFTDRWQGIPIEGYNTVASRMLRDADLELLVDFNDNRDYFGKMAKRVIYTGAVDALFDYCEGKLEYRSLRFEHELLNENNRQGVAVVNYTSKDVPYTRTIEHKHFLFGDDLPYTVVSKEYPVEASSENEPYYPIENARNIDIYNKYSNMALDSNYVLCGRLAEYKYYDMQDTINSALSLSKRIIEGDA